MKNNKIKIIIVASTNGSVMNKLLENNFFKECIFSVVSDRNCGAIDSARKNYVDYKIINESNKSLFCNKLLDYLIENKVDYVISFFTKLFEGEILNIYKDKIINLHPALLPSFKGLDGFGDTVKYGTRYIGSTIHFIDSKMDEGRIIMQTVAPLDLNKSINYNRNIIFQQQCKSLLQTIKWLSDERISIVNDKVSIKDAVFHDFEFSPSLDFTDAKNIFKEE